MHIYLDESGSFVVPPATGTSSVSTVGALVVPACYESAIWKRYKRIRPTLLKGDDEVKGRSLNEAQVDGVVSMLLRTPVIFEVAAIDLGLHSNAEIIKHRDTQAQKLSEHLGPDHSETQVAEVQQLAHRLTATSPQLYTESVLLFRVAWNVLQDATLLYSQILPHELGAFRWTFDAKDIHGVTDWEDWWRSMIAAFAQSHWLRESFITLKQGDYSHFNKAFVTESTEWFNKLSGREGDAIDASAILQDFSFDGGVNYGLEIADILTNAIRRALMDNLRESGWANISKLIPAWPGVHRVRLLSLNGVSGATVPYFDVLKKLDRYSKSLAVTA